MGFGSFKDKFKKATGISVSKIGGGISATSIIGGLFGEQIIDFISDPTGAKAAAKEQAKALRAAGRIEEAKLLEQELFRAQVREQFTPFREQGERERQRLEAQQPGETQFFQRGLEKGTEAIAEQAAGFGLLESGGTQTAFGELGANLLTQEELNRQQGLQSAAALSQAGFGLELGSLQQEGALSGRLAQTEANIGAIQAQSKLANRQFWLGLGTQALGIGAGAFLGGPAGAAAGGAAGGSVAAGTAPATGGFQLQQPQFNTFRPQTFDFKSQQQQPQFGF